MSNLNFQSNKQVYFCIPARLASTRLPGKPLALLGDLPLVVRVVLRVVELLKQLELSSLKANTRIFVMTDSTQISFVLEEYLKKNIQNEPLLEKLRVVQTSPELASGTDRICAGLKTWSLQEDTEINSDTLVVNIQGDEPFFPIDGVLNLIRSVQKMGTLVYKNNSWNDFVSSSVVKALVVNGQNGAQFASYFSRAPIPWPRNILGANGTDWTSKLTQILQDSENPITSQNNCFTFYQHIGIYAYTWPSLQEFVENLPYSNLENTEGLEQLRAIEAGWNILIVETNSASKGIDTAEDLAQAQKLISTPTGQ